MIRFPALAVLLAAMATCPASAQLGMFTSEQRIDITREGKGERFPDGRPKVPEAALDRLKLTNAEEAWGALRRVGYNNQFEGTWKTVNVTDSTGDRMVGRVVTPKAPGCACP